MTFLQLEFAADLEFHCLLRQSCYAHWLLVELRLVELLLVMVIELSNCCSSETVVFCLKLLSYVCNCCNFVSSVEEHLQIL